MFEFYTVLLIKIILVPPENIFDTNCNVIHPWWLTETENE